MYWLIAQAQHLTAEAQDKCSLVLLVLPAQAAIPTLQCWRQTWTHRSWASLWSSEMIIRSYEFSPIFLGVSHFRTPSLPPLEPSSVKGRGSPLPSRPSPYRGTPAAHQHPQGLRGLRRKQASFLCSCLRQPHLYTKALPSPVSKALPPPFPTSAFLRHQRMLFFFF